MKITITISGAQGSGKTTAAGIIGKFLKDGGIPVKLLDGCGHRGFTGDLDTCHLKALKATVEIRTEQA